MEESPFDQKIIPFRPSTSAGNEKESGVPIAGLKWKDGPREFRSAKITFIYRTFAYTWIHEHAFIYSGQDETHSLGGADIPSLRLIDNLAEYLKYGWPVALPGWATTLNAVDAGKPISNMSIFCDDIFLCPQCGRFHEPKGPVMMFPWIGDDLKIDHEMIRQTIDSRSGVPEFRLILRNANDPVALKIARE